MEVTSFQARWYRSRSRSQSPAAFIVTHPGPTNIRNPEPEPEPEYPSQDVFSMMKDSIKSFGILSLISLVAGIIGMVLFVIGVGCYVYRLNHFVSSLTYNSNTNDFDYANQFWDFALFMMTLSIAWEVFGLITSFGLLLMILNCIFYCYKVRELSIPKRRMFKGSTILILGLLMCYMQSMLTLLHDETLGKVTRLLRAADQCENFTLPYNNTL